MEVEPCASTSVPGVHNAKWVCTGWSWRRGTRSMRGLGSGYALPASQHWLTLRHWANNQPVQTNECTGPVRV